MLSRVADNLYWMSRYLERAEHTGRLLMVKLESMLEESKDDAEISWRRVVAALSSEEFAKPDADAFDVTHALAFERFNPSSLISSLRLALVKGHEGMVRLSTEMWQQVNRLHL